MTSMIYDFDGRRWELTDEGSQCSYGEPCLIADDGAVFRAAEIVIQSGRDEFSGAGYADVTAYDVVAQGRRNNGAGIPSEEYHAFDEMLRRFVSQNDPR
jgi:hypothetical protein